MATTTVNTIKVGNTSVDEVIVNGVTVFKITTSTGTITYNIGKIYVNGTGYDGNSAYLQVKMDSIPNDVTINVVASTGTSYNSSTYTLSGNLKFAYGELTSTSPSITLRVANSSGNSYCMIGLNTLNRTHNTKPLIGGTIGYNGRIYTFTSGSYTLPLINIPYGYGTIMGENTNAYLLYGGYYWSSVSKQVYPATTWKDTVTITHKIRNLKVTT